MTQCNHEREWEVKDELYVSGKASKGEPFHIEILENYAWVFTKRMLPCKECPCVNCGGKVDELHHCL